MSHWWKYPLSDVLPFSLEVYYRFLESYGQAIWPWQLLALLAGLAILARVCIGTANASRLIVSALGVGWLVVAGLYFYSHYGRLFWAAPFFAAAFAIQGGLLLVCAALRLSFPSIQGSGRNLATIVLGIAIVGYPVLGMYVVVFDQLIEMFGLFPDATAIATLAILAYHRGWVRWPLMVIPALWCIVESTILITLGGFGGALLAFLACLALAAALIPKRASE